MIHKKEIKRKKKYYSNQKIYKISLSEGFTYLENERVFLDDIFRIKFAFTTGIAFIKSSQEGINLKVKCFICKKKVDSGYHVKKKLSQITQNICYICWKSNLSPKL